MWCMFSDPIQSVSETFTDLRKVSAFENAVCKVVRVATAGANSQVDKAVALFALVCLLVLAVVVCFLFVYCRRDELHARNHVNGWCAVHLLRRWRW